VLKDVRGIAFSHFTSIDVVRHPLVGRIVDAYESASSLEVELHKTTPASHARKK